MKRQKYLLATATAVMLLLIASDAFALDAYKDRRGVFFGLGLGGGIGGAEVDPINELTGFEDGREMGFATQIEVGSGVARALTLSGQGNWWARTVQVNDRSVEHHHLNFMPVARLYVLDSIYGTAGFGLGYAIFDSVVSGRETKHYQEMGVATKLGAGMEFWVNGTVAMGLETSYSRHFYSKSHFDTFTGGITIKWY